MARPALLAPGGFPARAVVWEWLNEHGRWRPYSAAVSHHLEQALQEDARGRVPLGPADAQLAPYVIDLQAMHQLRQDTGKGTGPPLGSARLGRPPLHAGLIASIPAPLCLFICAPFLPSVQASWYLSIYLSSLPLQGQGWRPERRWGSAPFSLVPCRVPALPVKNLNGTGPVHPALAGEKGLAGLVPGLDPGARSRCWMRVPAPALPSVTACLGAGMTGILLCAAGLPVCLTRAPKPVLHPPPVSKSDIKPVPGVNLLRPMWDLMSLCALSPWAGKNPEDVVRRYVQKVKNPPDEDCTICMERLGSASGYEGVLSTKGTKAELVGKLGKCGHVYHVLCLVAMYSNGNKDGSLQCPTCKAIYGEKTGTQPPGKMEFHLIPHSLPGHSDSKTIRIVYDIPTGIQGPEHPNPGKRFTARGFPRHCYLPDTEKGRKVLKLLLVAWERRLIFTVGTSSTTGESDTVVWNEIHHKTEFGSNLTGHGYPDPNYLDNVLAELLAQGVSEANIKD
uniref:E3 ubiquitin-protein ligase n=1 Tax=Nothoprocta perdicaria TaxID=30464 RepID=A0A8C6ZW55_NOTPE